ncbi:class D sortase [Salirhabdus salicampi]|uniref:class D sortase n=1 Tax=Salirhabdus salicampi TaxID=476102 RepID=UPI0020C48B7A|nr:class D sortase [Salirhabdus salicampi]MCP8617556.1 class D sortase [Salirhabdus salicampi]
MRKLLTYFSLLLFIGGGILLLLGGWQIYHEHTSVERALEEAKEKAMQHGEENTARVDQRSYKERMNFTKGDMIGILSIPAIDKELPIVEGTEEDELDKGVGHYSITALPGDPNQILLAGHRNTVFTGLDQLQPGSEIMVQMPYGMFTYIMTHTKIVDAHDTSIIKTSLTEEELVISTCYPFNYIGDAPERYIIYAYPAPK